MTKLSDNMTGALFMIGAMVSVATAETFLKATGGQLPLVQVLLLRGLLTTAFILLISPRMGGLVRIRNRKNLIRLTVRNLAEAGAALTYLAALLQMPLANVKAILQVMPLFLTLGAFLFFREPLGWRRMLAIGIGLCGMLLIVRPDAQGIDWVAMLALVSVLFATLRDLMTRTLPSELNSITIAFSASLTMVIVTSVLMIFTPWRPVTMELGALILGAAVSIVLGYIGLVQAMRQGEIAFVVLFRYTGLLWSMIFGWFVFQQWPDTLTLLGAAIIIATGAFTLIRESRLLRLTKDRVGPKEPMA